MSEIEHPEAVGGEDPSELADAESTAAFAGTDVSVGELFEQLIRRRAFEISQRADAGTDHENWIRAERELRAMESDAPGEALEESRDVESGVLLAAEIQALGHP